MIGQTNSIVNSSESGLNEYKEQLRLIANRYLESNDKLPINCTWEELIAVFNEYDEYSYMNAFLNSIEVFPDKDYSINDTEGHIKGLRPYAFYQNTAIQSLLFSGIKNITSTNCFNNASALETVEMRNLETSSSNFVGCTALKKIIVPKLTELALQFFDGCVSINKILLPSVSKINNYSFRNVRNAYIIMKSLSIVGDNRVFYGGYYKYIDMGMIERIGYSLAQVEAAAFADLSAIVIRKKNSVSELQSTSQLSFLKTYNLCKFYVNYSILNTYRTATNWVTYADKIDSIQYNLITLQSLGGYIDDFYTIVESLPTQDIEIDMVYLIPTQSENVYEQWVHCTNQWEQLSNITLTEEWEEYK